MASRATSYWRAMLSRTGGNRMFATSTTPKMKPFAPTVDSHSKPRSVKGEFVPIYMVMGMVLLALTFGTHTVKQQLQYSPSVHVSKKKREMLAELENPDDAVEEGNKLIRKSFFRKVAHIQDLDRDTVPNPIRGDIYTMPAKAETLKSVGVDPRQH